MNLEKFRMTHSLLIEHYQFIEAHLEGIYAAVCGKPLLEGLKDVEKDGLSGILGDILRVEREKKIDVLSDEDCEQLRQLFQRRNFWCHSCYCEIAFDRETGSPAKISDVQCLLEDLQTAELWRERLFHKKRALLKQRTTGKSKKNQCLCGLHLFCPDGILKKNGRKKNETIGSVTYERSDPGEYVWLHKRS